MSRVDVRAAQREASRKTCDFPGAKSNLRAIISRVRPSRARGARAAATEIASGRGEYMAKKTARKAAKGSKKKTGGRKRTANAAFMRPVTPDATVAEVVGSKPIPRTEVTKRLWAYIKKNGLQDKKNKRMINADAPLKAVFGGKSSVNMFEMTKLVNKHLK
jgi:chromatin remodeling complex protein RSC6